MWQMPVALPVRGMSLMFGAGPVLGQAGYSLRQMLSGPAWLLGVEVHVKDPMDHECVPVFSCFLHLSCPSTPSLDLSQELWSVTNHPLTNAGLVG